MCSSKLTWFRMALIGFARRISKKRRSVLRPWPHATHGGWCPMPAEIARFPTGGDDRWWRWECREHARLRFGYWAKYEVIARHGQTLHNLKEHVYEH